MSNLPSKTFLQSTPFKIHWAGFESDTLRLQNNGWTLSVEDQFDFIFHRHWIRFVLRHEMLDLYAVTTINTIDFHDITDYFQKCDGYLPFNITVIAKDIIYKSMPDFKMDFMKEIDAQPSFIEVEQKQISKLHIFKTLIKPENALIVEPDQIASLLEKIVAAQSPKQKEIRERIRKADSRDNLKQTLHAQILSVAA